MKRVFIFPLLILLVTVGIVPPVSAQSSVTTVITALDSNAAGDGYIVRTPKGDFEMAYGAGGYGRFGQIFDLVLESIEKKFPVTLILGPSGIQDVVRPDKN